MSARRGRTVAYVSGAVLALTAVVGGAAVALTHSDATGAPRSNPRTKPPITSEPTNASQHDVTTPTPTVSTASVKVTPLGKLTPPDMVVRLSHAASTHAVDRLRKRAGVHRVAVADSGTIRVHRAKLHVLGVPISVRGFTPSLTGASKPLWQSVARGELTVAYANGRRLRHHLGQTYVATGRHSKSAPTRIGAFATIGLPGAQALLSHPAAAQVGLAPRRVVLIAAPKLALDALTADVRNAFGPKAHLNVTRAAPVDQSVSSGYAQSVIPTSYLDLYRRAAVTCPGLPWTVLAGIGTVETGNGSNVHRSTAGAEGPMQFMPSTWAMYGYDADGDGKADIQSPTDSIFSAARYLCAAGAGRGGQSLDNAIFSYNHAWWYVREVVVLANRYA